MSEVLGKDLSISDGDIQFTNSQEFEFRVSYKNLVQAIITRIRTAKGEYHNILYGSEVNKVYGSVRNDLARNRLVGFIGECLRQEPRVSSINEINIQFPEDDKFRVDVTINVTPIQSQVPLNVIFPLFI